MEDFLVNHTAKRYLFEQSAVREFYSGAYYDLFLVMRGSGVFRCSEVVLPAQQQNLIIFKPDQGGRLEYAGAYGPLELIRVQLSPQTLAQLSDADTDLEKSFNVVPSRQVAVRPDSQIYMLLKNLARKLLMLPFQKLHRVWQFRFRLRAQNPGYALLLQPMWHWNERLQLFLFG